MKEDKQKEQCEICVECSEDILVHEIEILNVFYEIGGYCNNPNCKRYKILLV